MRQPPLPDDPDALCGPGGLTLREVHTLVRKSVALDQTATREAAQRKGGLLKWVTNWWRRPRAGGRTPVHHERRGTP